MKFFKKLDTGLDSVLKYFTGTLIVLLTIIVNIMVFSRYVLRVNLGGFEELPVFFMCICIWLGGVRVSRNDKHVKIEILYTFIKNEKAQLILRGVTTLIAAVVLTYFCYSAWQFVSRSYTKGTITPALAWPAWIVYLFMLFGAIGMTVYSYVNTVKYFKEAAKK